MNYPCIWLNNDTHKLFTVTKLHMNVFNGEGECIRCVEPYGEHSGECRFHVTGTVLDLHVIQSRPEKGTGLGSLMMYLLSVEALRYGCNIINVLSAAANERSFYFQMGCEHNTDFLDLQLASMTTPAPSSEIWPGVYLAPSDSPSIEEADAVFKSAPIVGQPPEVMVKASASVQKRWEKQF